MKKQILVPRDKILLYIYVVETIFQKFTLQLLFDNSTMFFHNIYMILKILYSLIKSTCVTYLPID